MVKVAIVTGSNKGIGFEIVRSLCPKFDGDVYLTSRNVQLGEAAVKLLQNEGLAPKYHQLDITDESSIEKLRDSMLSAYGGVDVLINNAGIWDKSDISFREQVRLVMDTNFHGTRNLCNALLPLMRDGGRVVTVSSSLSWKAVDLFPEDVQEELKSPDLTEQRLCQIVKDFEMNNNGTEPAMKGKPRFVNIPYAVSKLALNALSRIQASKMKEDGKEGVLVNACCPGFCRTDLVTSGKLINKFLFWLLPFCKNAQSGADTPVYCALLPEGTVEPNGSFIMNREVQEWMLR